MTTSLTGCESLKDKLAPKPKPGFCPLPNYMSDAEAKWYEDHKPLPDAVAQGLKRRLRINTDIERYCK